MVTDEAGNPLMSTTMQLWGGLVGWLVYRLYCRVTIPAGYSLRLCYVPVGVLCLTVVWAVVYACIV